jgi:hypothetical protein
MMSLADPGCTLDANDAEVEMPPPIWHAWTAMPPAGTKSTHGCSPVVWSLAAGVSRDGHFSSAQSHVVDEGSAAFQATMWARSDLRRR